jgi:hypothetical protein
MVLAHAHKEKAVGVASCGLHMMVRGGMRGYDAVIRLLSATTDCATRATDYVRGLFWHARMPCRLPQITLRKLPALNVALYKRNSLKWQCDT